MSIYHDKEKGWIIDGQSNEEWEALHQPISKEELAEYGILDEVKDEVNTEKGLELSVGQVDEIMDMSTRDTHLPYEKLTVGETLQDIGKTVGVEASKIVLRNPNSANNFITKHIPREIRDLIPVEGHYHEKTRAAEFFKYGYRYGLPIVLSFFTGGAWGGIQAVTKGDKAIKGINALSKGAKALDKAQKLTTKQRVARGVFGGTGIGAAADFLLYRPDEHEGQMLDFLGKTDNELVNLLQSNPQDSELVARTKNTVSGFLAGGVIGLLSEFGLAPLGKAFGEKLVPLFKKGDTEAMQQVQAEADVLATTLDNVSEGQQLLQSVKNSIEKAGQENVDDIERYVLQSEYVNASNEQTVLDLVRRLQLGQEIEPLENGTFVTKVNEWKDAANVSPEELAKQTGGDGVDLMDKTVKDTWTERGWLAEGEDLVTKTENSKDVTKPAKVTVNTKATNRVVKNYKDKWQIDNNIKVEWTDGKIKGADGNTSSTTYLGKNAKNTQGSIDKKKLQIAKLEKQLEKPNEIPNANGKKQKVKATDESKEAVQYAYELLAQAKGTTVSVLKRQLKGKNAEKVIQELQEAADKLDADGIDPKYSKYFHFNKDQIGSENTHSVIEQALNIIRHGWTSTDDLGLDKALEDIYNEAVSIFNKTQDIDNVEAYIVKNAPEEYQEAMLSTIYKSINENSGLDKRALLEEALRIAKNDLEHLEASANKTNIIPDILIQIDKNCKNPHAVLRSELEHARDIAKGTVPNQKEKHFSRYNGINESEMSLEYVKKKADTRAGKTVEEPKAKEVVDDVVTDKDLDWLDEQQAKTNVTDEPKYSNLDNFLYSDEIGEASIKDLFADDDFYKSRDWYAEFGDTPITKMEKGEADLFNTNQTYNAAYVSFDDSGNIISFKVNPNFKTEDIEFCILHEIGHLKQRKLALTDETIAKQFDELDKMIENGVDYDTYRKHPLETDADSFAIEETKGKQEYYGHSQNKSNQQKTKPVEGYNNDVNENRGIESGRSTQDSNPKGERNVPSEESGTEPTTSNRPISERIKDTDGDLNRVDKVIDDVINSDPELSGTDFVALAEDADSLYTRLKSICGDNLLAFKKAFASRDIDLVNYMTRKALAAERVISDTIQKLKEAVANGEDITDLLSTVHYLQSYTSELASAYGRGLNEQKFVNKARNFFAITTLEKQGLDSFIDLLHTSFTSLNFTQNIKQLKQEVYKQLKQASDGAVFDMLTQNPSFAKAIDDILTHCLTNKDTSRETIEKLFNMFRNQARNEEAAWLIKNAADDEAIAQGLKNWKALKTYYITNLLSSPRTQFVNIASGIANTLYAPLKKIVASIWDSNLKSEGIYQFFALKGQIKESLKLGMKAFENGEGVMVNIKPMKMDNTNKTEAFELGSWKNDKGQIPLLNYFTVFNRFMSATDEFITQLNYRAIVKAQGIQQAEQGADLLKLTGKDREDYIADMSEKYFKNAFTSDGKPMDVQAYYEARQAVYQESLTGKYYDWQAGQNTQLREETWTMSIGQGLQQAVEKAPVLKFFYPFLRTPANILQQNLDHNLLYAICSPAHRRLLSSDTKQGRLAKAQLAIGFMNFSLASMWALSGNITGSAPSDKKTKEALFATGWQPYSIKIGDKYISYRGYEPIQSILGFAADSVALTQAFTHREEMETPITSLTLQAGKLLINNFLDKSSFRTSTMQMNNIFEAIESGDDKVAQRVLGQFGKGFLPLSSLGNFVGNVTHPERMKANTWYEALSNKYFGIITGGDYRRNVWGERQDLYNAVITSYSYIDDMPEDLEFQRLAELGWKVHDLTSRDTSSKSNYKDYKGEGVSNSLYDQILEAQSTVTLEGKTLREAIRELIESEEYLVALDGITPEEQGTKDTKINYIKAVFKRYRDAAKQETIKEWGEYYYDKEGRTLKEAEIALREAQEAALLEAQLEQDLQNIRSFN